MHRCRSGATPPVQRQPASADSMYDLGTGADSEKATALGWTEKY